MNPAPIDPRVLTSATAFVVAALLLLLYAYRRRLFIVCWIAAWTGTGSAYLLGAQFLDGTQIAAMLYGVAQFLAIVSALVLVLAADAYRHRPRVRRTYALLLLPVAIWFTLAPAALGPLSVFAPGHLLIAGGFATAGIAHLLLLRQVRLVGASIVGAALLAIAGVHVWTAATIPTPHSPAAALPILVRAGLFLVAALGMQLMTFEDMTYELRRTNRRLAAAQTELHHLAITDPLTGCRNRRFFDEIIGRELQRHARYGSPLSMLFIDIDRFKVINDTLGHETGDRVLQHVAAFLVSNIREADYVFRWGGDEFLVLITCSLLDAHAKGARLQALFDAAPETAALPPGVALSIGAVEVPAGTADVMPLVQVADEQMYVNKRARR